MTGEETIGSAAELHAAATELTGLADFGGGDYRDGLAVLLESYARDAGLTPKGDQGGPGQDPRRADGPAVQRGGLGPLPGTRRRRHRPADLRHRAAAHRHHRAAPAARRGSGASGLRAWLAEVPQPRPPRHTWAADPLFQAIQAGFDRHHVSHPEFMAVHYMAADQVEECWQLLRQSMRSISFECLAHLPGYASWLRGQDWTDAYRRHRRNLQLIGLPDRDRRWVLKNPSHLFALDALLRVYPDALVIQTHRDPRAAIASVCSLAAQATAGWSTTFRARVIGRDQLETWAGGLEEFTGARARHDPARFCDIEYHDFVVNPLGTVESVYRHFGLPLSGWAADAMRALCEQSAGAGGPAHHYALADFGLTGEQVDERFAGYHRARA